MSLSIRQRAQNQLKIDKIEVFSIVTGFKLSYRFIEIDVTVGMLECLINLMECYLLYQRLPKWKNKEFSILSQEAENFVVFLVQLLANKILRNWML